MLAIPALPVAAAVLVWSLLTAETRLLETVSRGFRREVHPTFYMTAQEAGLTPFLLFSADRGAIGHPDADVPLLTWEEARAELNPRLFLKGYRVPRRVTVNHPRAQIEYMPETGRWNLEEFLTGLMVREPRFRELLREGVHIENAVIQVVAEPLFGDKEPRTISDLHMTIRRKTFYPGVWEFSGHIGRGHLRGAEIRGVYDRRGLNLQISLNLFNVDDSFIDWVPGGDVIERLFAPRGLAGADFTLQLKNTETGFVPSWHGRLHIHDMQAVPMFYPVQTENLSGMIEIAGHKVNYRNITGLVHTVTDAAEIRTPFRISGSTDLEEWTTSLSIAARDLPVTEETMQKIPQAGERLWDSIKAGGAADLDLVLRSENRGNDTIFNARAVMNDVSASVEGIPFPLQNVFGKLLIDQDRVLLERIKGRTGREGCGASLLVDGEFNMQGELEHLCVEFADFHFDPELIEHIPSGAPQALKELTPSGQLSGVLRIREDGSDITGSFQVMSGKAETDHFPLPLRDISGRIHIADRSLHIESLKAAVEYDMPADAPHVPDGIAFFDISGKYNYDDGGGRFDVNARDIQLTEDIVKSIPVWGERIWESVRPAGMVSIGGSMAFEGRSPETEGLFYLLDTRLKNLSVQWSGFPLLLSSLSGNMLVSNDLIHIPHLSGTVCGGTASMHGFISGIADLEHVRYGASIDVQRLDLRKLIREMTGREMDVAGKLTGVVEIAGRMGGEDMLKGQGELSLTEGRVWQAPVFFGLIDILHLAQPGAHGNFDRGQIQYSIRDELLDVRHFELRSPSAEMTGWGTIGLTGGELDLTIVAASTPESGVPLLTPALRAILRPVQRELIRVHVTGTISEPRYSFAVIGRLTWPAQTLYDLFTFPFRIWEDDEE